MVFPFLTGLGSKEVKPKKIEASLLLEEIEQGKIIKVIIQEKGRGYNVSGDYNDGSRFESYIAGDPPYTLLIEDLQAQNIFWETKQEEKASFWSGLLSSLFAFLPFILFFVLLLWMMGKKENSAIERFTGGRRKFSFPVMNPLVAFQDVAGVQEAKEELQEVVEFLRFPEKFQQLGARVPKGVLLVGPPGTGKTLLAKAVAGEANVPFYNISGSEFVELFVGVGASRVRELFDNAKRNAPCIVFIDELDAVGRYRGLGLGGDHDEREQTLNQILVEMDGFEPNTNIVVIAATNRPDILDPALIRPGRFDRQVVLDLPDMQGRKEILEIHVKGKPIEENVSLECLARQTPGFSGADLANLVNEAAILAVRRGKSRISLQEFEEAVDRVIAGPERKSRVISPKEREIIAYHEAGHALVANTLPNVDPVHKITVVARGIAGGWTKLLPTEDRRFESKIRLKENLAVLLGGYAAEQLKFNDVTTGSKDDLRRATEITREMVVSYGMSEKFGPRTFGKRQELIFLGKEITEQRDYSDKTAQEIDEEVNKMILSALDTAKRVLTERREKLELIVKRLMEKETLEGQELEMLLAS